MLKKPIYTQQIRDLFKYHKEQWKKLWWISQVIQVPYETLKNWNRLIKKWKELKDNRFWNSTKKKTFSNEDLVEYIENNENVTLKEIWDNFNVTDVAILKRLRNINYSYKKKRWDIKKEMKRKERNSNKN